MTAVTNGAGVSTTADQQSRADRVNRKLSTNFQAAAVVTAVAVVRELLRLLLPCMY